MHESIHTKFKWRCFTLWMMLRKSYHYDFNFCNMIFVVEFSFHYEFRVVYSGINVCMCVKVKWYPLQNMRNQTNNDYKNGKWNDNVERWTTLWAHGSNHIHIYFERMLEMKRWFRAKQNICKQQTLEIHMHYYRIGTLPFAILYFFYYVKIEEYAHCIYLVDLFNRRSMLMLIMNAYSICHNSFRHEIKVNHGNVKKRYAKHFVTT